MPRTNECKKCGIAIAAEGFFVCDDCRAEHFQLKKVRDFKVGCDRHNQFIPSCEECFAPPEPIAYAPGRE